ncbi:hypothetical protein niasHT_018387 [Heterodera trifolii]|uniref:Uncharacterized protein n=1 Tax=Heterodera trifolii TaxID=157864 RepID=A0ABD2LDL2_9BILA
MSEEYKQACNDTCADLSKRTCGNGRPNSNSNPQITCYCKWKTGACCGGEGCVPREQTADEIELYGRTGI